LEWQGHRHESLDSFGILLVATTANAQTYTTVVDRDTRTVTTTGPSATVTTTQTARSGTSATYTTSYQPMGTGGCRPMGH